MWKQRKNRIQTLHCTPLAPRQIHNQSRPAQPRHSPAQPCVPIRSSATRPHRLRKSRNLPLDHAPRRLRRHIPRTQPGTSSGHDQLVLLVAEFAEQSHNRVFIIRNQPSPDRLLRPLLRKQPRHSRSRGIHLLTRGAPIRNRYYSKSRHLRHTIRSPRTQDQNTTRRPRHLRAKGPIHPSPGNAPGKLPIPSVKSPRMIAENYPAITHNEK